MFKNSTGVGIYASKDYVRFQQNVKTNCKGTRPLAKARETVVTRVAAATSPPKDRVAVPTEDVCTARGLARVVQTVPPLVSPEKGATCSPYA